MIDHPAQAAGGLLGVRVEVVIELGWLLSSPCSWELAAAKGFLGMESVLYLGSLCHCLCTSAFESESYSEF